MVIRMDCQCNLRLHRQQPKHVCRIHPRAIDVTGSAREGTDCGLPDRGVASDLPHRGAVVFLILDQVGVGVLGIDPDVPEGSERQ